MFKIRKQFAGAIMGTLLGFAGAGGGCDPLASAASIPC